MDERPLVEGYIANFGISLDVFEFFAFWIIFLFFKKIGFLGILGRPYCGIGATIRIGRDFYFIVLLVIGVNLYLYRCRRI